jgi:hypothetical protein
VSQPQPPPSPSTQVPPRFLGGAILLGLAFYAVFLAVSLVLDVPDAIVERDRSSQVCRLGEDDRVFLRISGSLVGFALVLVASGLTLGAAHALDFSIERTRPFSSAVVVVLVPVLCLAIVLGGASLTLGVSAPIWLAVTGLVALWTRRRSPSSRLTFRRVVLTLSLGILLSACGMCGFWAETICMN